MKLPRRWRVLFRHPNFVWAPEKSCEKARVALLEVVLGVRSSLLDVGIRLVTHFVLNSMTCLIKSGGQ